MISAYQRKGIFKLQRCIVSLFILKRNSFFIFETKQAQKHQYRMFNQQSHNVKNTKQEVQQLLKLRI